VTGSAADWSALQGAGTRLGELYDTLAGHGRTIPAGCGPDVGIAGLTLGGGLGIPGRRHGLTCDHLLAAQVVLADGRLVDCDDHHEQELLWALRGAGGGHFGVATSLVFTTVPTGRPSGTWPSTAPARTGRWAIRTVKHTVVIDSDTPPADRDAARRWLARSWDLAHPWATGGVYPNFPDPDLRDPARAYHGTNLDRLRRVKGRYDPAGFL
jgi:FAD/FMN-containing dehydrogenase